MKIKINELETYEIDLPTECDLSKFNFIVERFMRIQKSFGRDILTQTADETSISSTHVRKPYRKSGMKFNWTREEYVELMKIYYSPISKAEKIERLAQKGITDYKTFSACCWSQRKKYGIRPEEVGLYKYPTAAEATKIADLQLNKNINNNGTDGTNS